MDWATIAVELIVSAGEIATPLEYVAFACKSNNGGKQAWPTLSGMILLG